jgi:hypothetical protein
MVGTLKSGKTFKDLTAAEADTIDSIRALLGNPPP